MNVLYVSHALVVGAYRDKLTALAEHVNVRAVLPDRWGGTPVEAIEPGPAPLERWPVVLGGRNHFHLYRRAARMLDGGSVDLVHVDEEPYSAVTLQLMRHASRRGVPAVFFAWQNLEKRLPPPFGAVRSAVFRRAAGAIAGTQAAAEVLRGAGYGGPLAVIPQFGVDPKRFAPDPGARARTRSVVGAAERELLVAFAGRLVPEKGVHVLVQAVAAVPTARLLVLGDGPERARLARLAGQNGAGPRVRFAGHRPSREMPDWLAGCDVLVLPSLGRPSWTEQFGRVLIEAMACEVAVVGARSGEIPAVVGDAGVIVASGDPVELAAVLRDLAAEPGNRTALARRGRMRVLERYTNERIAAKTAGFYRRLRPAPGAALSLAESGP